MQQKRLILALLISTAILFLWSYFFPVSPPKQSKPQEATVIASPTPSVLPETQPAAQPTVSPTAHAGAQARRTVVVRTPLYEAKFDTEGAGVISWVIKKNKDTQRPIYSSAGSKGHSIPLELVSPEGLKRRELPFHVTTGDTQLDSVLSTRNYSIVGIEGVDNTSGEATIELAGNEKRSIEFQLNDSAGLIVKKRLEFDAQSYTTDVALTIMRGDQPVPQAKLSIGPSISDQGVEHHTFYSVAPEAIAVVGNKVERHTAATINENGNSPDRLSIPGPVDWAGVGDTYFAMVAIPPKSGEGLEYRTVQYDHPSSGKPEKRYLLTALVPVPTDGSRTIVYVGPKDHYILTQTSAAIGAEVARPIDLEGLIDYGWFSWLSRPLSVPILRAIKWLHSITNSYGVAIILFTIVIYSLFFPLKWRSSKAMKKAQKLAPKMKELQEKIKGLKQNDPRLKELQKEQLLLMKEGNPLGGCLPLLIQMPFLFALYRAITISLDFRQATFLWLPDLSGGDPFHILEFLMAGTMIVLQLITPAPSADPLQRKMMAIGMPLFMLYVLWGAPSGLLLYWLVGNIVGFSQQFLINRWTGSEGDSKNDEQPPTPKRARPQQEKKVVTSRA